LKAGSETVLVRQPLSRSDVPSIVVSKPVLARGFDPQRIYEKRAPGVVTVTSRFGTGPDSSVEQGSGFVVSTTGIVLTAAHVITAGAGTPLATPARAVYVQFADGDRISAHVVGWDPYDDVGVLRVRPSAHRLVPVPLGNSAHVAVGQPIAAIGSPFGAQTSLSVGVISGTGRTIPSLTTRYDLFDAIQIDAPINQGSSGGPLLDSHGRVIGINAQLRSGFASGFDGVGFAVPIDSARRSMLQLLTSGRVRYAYLGLQTEDLTPEIARAFGYTPSRGAIVDTVSPGGPAAKAGLVAGTKTVNFQGERLTVGGDAIVAINGTSVASSDDVARVVSELLVPGEHARFTIFRRGRRLVVPVTLGARPR
jgi:S1-C subfamily serine protease